MIPLHGRSSECLAQWQTPHGQGSIERLRPDVVLLSICGQIDMECGAMVVDALRKALDTAAKTHFFLDLKDLQGYHSSTRVEGVRVLSKGRHKLTGVSFYTGSRIVKMGMSMVNVALPGFVRTFSSREAFLDALGRALDGDAVG